MSLLIRPMALHTTVMGCNERGSALRNDLFSHAWSVNLGMSITLMLPTTSMDVILQRTRGIHQSTLVDYHLVI